MSLDNELRFLFKIRAPSRKHKSAGGDTSERGALLGDNSVMVALRSAAALLAAQVKVELACSGAMVRTLEAENQFPIQQPCT